MSGDDKVHPQDYNGTFDGDLHVEATVEVEPTAVATEGQDEAERRPLVQTHDVAIDESDADKVLSRRDKMVNAAVWLAEQGCFIGWGDVRHGKAVKHTWKSDMTDDRALVPGLLHGARNSVVIPARRVVVIDIDKFGWYEKLVEAGLPTATFTVITPSRRGGPDGEVYDSRQVYGLMPVGYSIEDIPDAWAGGETRRSLAGEQNMVLGPWAKRTDGIYTPAPGTPRRLAVIPDSVFAVLRANPAAKTGKAARVNGAALAEGPWQWDEATMGSRHNHMLDMLRGWRGSEPDPDILEAKGWAYFERHGIPVVVDGREVTKAEMREMAEGAVEKFDDDPPVVAGPTVEPVVVEAEAGDWLEAPDPRAFHGVLGDIVRAVTPYTEADPIGLMGTLLAMFGSACGRNPALYQGSMQRTNLTVLLVGATGFGGRKGTSLDVCRSVFRLAYPDLDRLWLVGVASGEAISGHYLRLEAAGKKEPRALLVETEFGRLLTVMGRPDNSLSPVLRNAWDGVPLGHARSRDESLVTDHHVSIIGHITPVELRQKLTDVDAANGFANRVLFVAVKRTRLIPFPVSPDEIVRPYVSRVAQAIVSAGYVGESKFDEDAADRWESFYGELAVRPRLGLAGAVTGRHEAQVARLALVYSLADGSSAVRVQHLEAAIAFAEYARRSVVWALGDSTGNRHADVLRGMLSEGEVPWDVAKRSLSLRQQADMVEVVKVLTDAGLAHVVALPREGGGRPTRVIRGGAKGAKGAKGAGGART